VRASGKTFEAAVVRVALVGIALGWLSSEARAGRL